MEIIRILKFKKLIHIFLICFLCNCQEKKEKSVINQNNTETPRLENSCFIKQNIIKESEGFIYKYEDFEFKFKQNEDFTNNLLINDKNYGINLSLESAEIHFHYYRCNDRKVFFIEGDDYYSSTFYVYYYENMDLFYLGTFSIDQPNVEDEGVFSKEFKIIKIDDQIKIQSYLDGKTYENNTLILNKKIKISNNSNSSISSPLSILNRWNYDYMPEIRISEQNIIYVFHGQCIYTFGVNVIDETQVELIWSLKGRDCVFELGLDETFDLPKTKVPQEGKPFAKYTLDNNKVKVAYYYKEWVDKFHENVEENTFVNEFTLNQQN